jgi:hypothetical protein
LSRARPREVASTTRVVFVVVVVAVRHPSRPFDASRARRHREHARQVIGSRERV